VILALAEFYELYLKILNEHNCLDFATIQTITHKLFEQNPIVQKTIQERIKYMMIDEYQDTNTIQEAIIFQILDSATQNICVVGDDDQGLYRFRGASIRNILEFGKNFEGNTNFREIKLENNYRSHPGIIKFYSDFIRSYQSDGISSWQLEDKNFRFDKNLKAQDKSFPTYNSVVKVSSSGDVSDWHNEVLRFIKDFKDKGILQDYNQIAFLFRSVASEKTIDLVNFLEENDIHVFSPRSDLFFKRSEIRLIFGAMIYLFPDLIRDLQWDESAELKTWAYYDDCSKYFLGAIIDDLTKHQALLDWCHIKREAHRELKENADYGFGTLFYNLLAFPMFSEILNVELNSPAYDLRAAYNLGQFSKILVKYEFLKNLSVFTVSNFEYTKRHFFNIYMHYLIRGGIEEFSDFDEYAPKGCISFMTVHQAKGLEFPIVMVDSLSSIPKNKAKSEIEIDELLQQYHKKPLFEPNDLIKYFDFYRLFYTAFSRPQNLLVLSCYEKNEGHKSPSKYFQPLYNSLLSWNDPSNDYSNLHLEELKPVNIKKQYAFTSNIILYEKCPYQYKFYKELEFAAVKIRSRMFGVLVHQTIEDVHKMAIQKKYQEINDENIEIWYNQNYNELSKILKTQLGPNQKIAALKQVKDYAQKLSNNWDMIQEAEVDISLVKDKYILKGTIDLIRGENGTIEIIDFKSEKVKPDPDNPLDKPVLEQYKRQLEIYSHIVEEKNNIKVSQMHLYYTGAEDPYITFPKSNENIESTIDVITQTVENIEKKTFVRPVANMGKKLCGDCDFHPYCEAEVKASSI
ncbi:MAG: ATP-dependent DNA helicase, partial [Candidatus Kapabacteria bacterium]|nr:ATP-dependent DNA helicase [Candidatus Kapabacteria bacterium]